MVNEELKYRLRYLGAIRDKEWKSLDRERAYFEGASRKQEAHEKANPLLVHVILQHFYVDFTCPCGYAGDISGRCRCTPDQIARYRSRISGPLLDRIDLVLEVPRLEAAELRQAADGERSADVRARVAAARAHQLARAGKPNAWLGNRESERDAVLGEREQQLLERAVERLGLSARAWHRILRVARTIADLDGAGTITSTHLSEAIQYRRFARA